MAIPEQVKKQSEAVQQLYEDLNPEEGVEAQPTGEVQADRVEEQATQSAPEEQTVAGTQDDKTLEQKYKTLQGMYNAEIPRLHADKRELAGRVGQLEQLLSSAPKQQAPQQAAEVSQTLVTEKDIEDYGDSIDVMRRVSQEETNVSNQRIAYLEQTIQQLQSNVMPRVEQLSQQQAQSSEHTFWSELSSVVPNWRDINEIPDFQTWLLDIDPLTGISRQTYLEDAQNNFDVRRVASFFSTWGAMNGAPRAQQESARPQSQLEKQIAPGKGKSTGAPAVNGDQTYTPADIASFYDAIKSGKYKGKDKERARTERDIFAAQRDGRIITA
jgi:hypothetical protein